MTVPTALANFVAAGFRPRPTMRRILDAGRDRMVLPLVLLAAISFALGDAERPNLGGLDPSKGLLFVLLAVAGVVAGLLFIVLLFYLFSWAATAIGRALEGQGSAREVRSAIAWGAVPFLWALLYRVPAAIWFPVTRTRVEAGSAKFTLDPAAGGSTCLTMVLFGMLEVLVLIWYLIVASNTLGEAHRFSAWRGLATILLTAATPIVIVVAAVLAA